MSPDAYREMADTEDRHWWFAGRRAILASVIGNLGLPASANILEIGCGTGGNLPMLSAFGNVSALETDATARMIALQKTGARFDIRDGSCPGNIPYANERFDLICLFDVLEHIHEDVDTLVALRELLSRGGRILVTVPAHRCLWSVHDEFLHHKRRYSQSELRRKAYAARLELTRISYFNMLLFPLIAMMRFKDRILGASKASGTRLPPSPINGILRTVFSAERCLLQKFDLPFGVSLLAVLRVS